MQALTIHPQNPQTRLIKQIVNALQNDKIILLPTDNGHALAIDINSKIAFDKLNNLQSDGKYSLICRNLSEISTYAIIDDENYRNLKSSSTGEVFALKATKNTPKKLIHPKNKTINVQIATQYPLHQAILEALNTPFIILTIIDKEDFDHLNKSIDLLIETQPF